MDQVFNQVFNQVFDQVVNQVVKQVVGEVVDQVVNSSVNFLNRQQSPSSVPLLLSPAMGYVARASSVYTINLDQSSRLY